MTTEELFLRILPLDNKSIILPYRVSRPPTPPPTPPLSSLHKLNLGIEISSFSLRNGPFSFHFGDFIHLQGILVFRERGVWDGVGCVCGGVSASFKSQLRIN